MIVTSKFKKRRGRGGIQIKVWISHAQLSEYGSDYMAAKAAENVKLHIAGDRNKR